jgi:hypothetical protein
MRFSAPIVLALLLGTAACKDTPPSRPDNGGTANLTAANIAPLAEKSNDPAALREAFAAAFETPKQQIGDDNYGFTPTALYRLDKAWVLLSEGTGPDCHACSGWLAVHYLNRTDKGFQLVKGWNDAIPGTSFGGAPQWQVRTDLTTMPVIESEGGGTWQGYSCTVARLTELTPDGPKPLVERIPLAYSDGGAIIDGSKPKQVDGSIVEGERGKSFTVRYKGTVTRDIPYTLQGNGFTAGKGADQIPQC